jgi:hypothetical protein
MRRNESEFVWDTIGTIDDLLRVRMSAMEDFIVDFTPGAAEGRYVPAALPALPFPDSSFGLALCSHLLFLYSEQLDGDFHLQSLLELCRIADEVRVFPLAALGGVPSPHFDRCVAHLRDGGFEVSVERVPYEFQRGVNQMLRIGRSARWS